jgi:glycerophosphoryl diester phosphodiesterase
MMRRRRLQLQGHRGARGLFPENTLAGFAGALAIGVDALELDVAVTADSVVVVSHEPRLNPDITRGPDGAWLDGSTPAISSLTQRQLRSYDVGRIRPGTAYAAAFPDQRAQDGARIPTLAEVFALDPEVSFTVELKTAPDEPNLTAAPAVMAELVVADADAARTTSRTTVQSFDWRGLRHLRRRRPDVALAWLTQAQSDSERLRWWDGVSAADHGGSVPRAVTAEGGSVWVPQCAELSERLVEEAHALDLLVVPWDVDRPGDMQRLIGWGVDGLITDRPDLARSILAAASGIGT